MAKKSRSTLTALSFTADSPRRETGSAETASMEAAVLSVGETEAEAALFDPRPIRSERSRRSGFETIGMSPSPPQAEPPLRPLPRLDPAADTEKRRSGEPAKAKRLQGTTQALPLWARSAYWVAVPASATWAGCMAAFAANYQNPFGAFEYRPYAMVAWAGLCLLPPVFILLAAFAVRQAAKLAIETRRARDLADELVVPAALAVDRASSAADAAEAEVGRAGAVAAAAERQLLELRRALSEESERLIQATDDAERRALDLSRGLAKEREEMTVLAKTLDASVQAVSEALQSQSRFVVEASDLAAAQVQEAEAVLAARAADLATTASTVAEVTTLAGDRLATEAQRLESVAGVVADTVGGVQTGLNDERGRLAALADSLRADQTQILAQIDAQRAQLLEASADARSSVEELTSASTQGAQSLRDLVADVAQQIGQLMEAAETDQAALSRQAKEHLKLFTGVVAEERAALEQQARATLESLAVSAAQSRDAALEHSETARKSVEQLGEAAFAASQRADQAFDARISAARRMIEQSAGLVEEAGQRSAERIEAGLGATQQTLKDLQSLLEEIDVKVSRLPADARARAESVREAVETGIGDLTAAARRAAEETQAIDAAFQGRIKQNYQVLSEALRLMGRAAGLADAGGKPASIAVPTSAPALGPPAVSGQGHDLGAPRPLAATRLDPASPLQNGQSAQTAAVQRPLHLGPLSVGAPNQGPVGHGQERQEPNPQGPGPSNGGLASPLASNPRQPLTAAQPAAPKEGERAIRLHPEGPSSPGAIEGDLDVFGLRPRLRLTPDAAPPSDARRTPLEVRSPAASAPAPSPAAPTTPAAPARNSGDWTWKDLLSSIDEPPMDDEVLAERLIAEIEALGLDVAALLPLGRIDEIAAVMHQGVPGGVREAVRSFAPSAVRRLSRRVLTDRVLRAQADRYVQRYEDLLADSAKRDRDGFVTATLLGSDPGRAFLLFKAAVGELH